VVITAGLSAKSKAIGPGRSCLGLELLSEEAALDTYETKVGVESLCELLRLYPLGHVLAYAIFLTDKT